MCVVVGKGVILGGCLVVLVLEIEEFEGLDRLVRVFFGLLMIGLCIIICIIWFFCRLIWFCDGYIFKFILIF